MKRAIDFFWPAIGIAAVIASFWLLSKEFQGQSIGPDVLAYLKNLPLHQYFLAALSTIAAYAALAWYDRIALLHLGITRISWAFVSICSFTTYALSHNIGASVFSGAMVRYRAYSTKGLTTAQIAILVALCSFTFALGVILLMGLVLVIDPNQLGRLTKVLPAVLTNPSTALALGFACLAFVALYVIGSILKLKPLHIGKFRLEYPNPDITGRQLIAAPLELLGAAGIIYFALPAEGNPGFFAVLAVFLASFSAGLVSNAPGGLGVFELVFINAMPSIPKAQVLAALLIFRLFYLIIPLLFAIVVVVLFERRRLSDALHRRPPDAV